MWRNCHILVFEWLSINLVELLKKNNHVGESLDDTRIIGTVQLRTVMWGYFLNCPNYSQLPIIRLVLINATGLVFYNSTYNRESTTKISDENERYITPEIRTVLILLSRSSTYNRNLRVLSQTRLSALNFFFCSFEIILIFLRENKEAPFLLF